MIKLFTLFVVLHNPITNTDATLPVAMYDEHACYAMEKVVNDSQSAMHIELTKLNVEIVETYCDSVIH